MSEYQLMQGDCLELFPSVPDKSVNIDVPFGKKASGG